MQIKANQVYFPSIQSIKTKKSPAKPAFSSTPITTLVQYYPNIHNPHISFQFQHRALTMLISSSSESHWNAKSKLWPQEDRYLSSRIAVTLKSRCHLYMRKLGKYLSFVFECNYEELDIYIGSGSVRITSEFRMKLQSLWLAVKLRE